MANLVNTTIPDITMSYSGLVSGGSFTSKTDFDLVSGDWGFYFGDPVLNLYKYNDIVSLHLDMYFIIGNGTTITSADVLFNIPSGYRPFNTSSGSRHIITYGSLHFSGNATTTGGASAAKGCSAEMRILDNGNLYIQEPNFTGKVSTGTPGTGLTGALYTVTGQQHTSSGSSYSFISLGGMSSYVGQTGRFVIQYISGTSYTGDLQIDSVNIGSTAYNFDSSADGFETTTFDSTVTTNTNAYYQGLSWTTIPATGGTSNRWNRDTGGTPSGSTGLTSAHTGSYYLYAEVSGSGYSNKAFWLRSPPTVMNTAYMAFAFGAYGATIGTFRVFWDNSGSGYNIVNDGDRVTLLASYWVGPT